MAQDSFKLPAIPRDQLHLLMGLDLVNWESKTESTATLAALQLCNGFCNENFFFDKLKNWTIWNSMKSHIFTQNHKCQPAFGPAGKSLGITKVIVIHPLYTVAISKRANMSTSRWRWRQNQGTAIKSVGSILWGAWISIPHLDQGLGPTNRLSHQYSRATKIGLKNNN